MFPLVIFLIAVESDCSLELSLTLFFYQLNFYLNILYIPFLSVCEHSYRYISARSQSGCQQFFWRKPIVFAALINRLICNHLVSGRGPDQIGRASCRERVCQYV